MTGQITNIKKQSALNKTGYLFWAYFHMEDGKSARTCLVPDFSNFRKWRPVIEKFEAGELVTVAGLDFVHGQKRLVDANSIINIQEAPKW